MFLCLEFEQWARNKLFTCLILLLLVEYSIFANQTRISNVNQ